MADSDDDTSWIPELETALLEGLDYGRLRTICRGRAVPHHLRAETWQICLNVVGKGDALQAFDGLFDMEEQSILRVDCQHLVAKLGNEDDESLSVLSDLESILTFYCKSRGLTYSSETRWLDILQPMLALKVPRSELYSIFYAFVTRFISKDCVKNGRPFHLFRLLLLYHDPELCSFLDSKRITPDMYAITWFQTLFAANCDLSIVLAMWDVYLQQGDPFLVFFLALVILVNAKDQLLAMENESKDEIMRELMTVSEKWLGPRLWQFRRTILPSKGFCPVLVQPKRPYAFLLVHKYRIQFELNFHETLEAFPGALELEDIEDFCALAQYYSSRTPQSFRRDYQNPLFGQSMTCLTTKDSAVISEALCLPVSVNELLQANKQDLLNEGVRYFVVDCRPAEQYNSGHLPTAFHLDANLMLQNPTEFSTAVQALFATQKQAILTGSVAGGEHLCFMGSGREEEDQYVHMVVAHFLQKNSQYVSVTRGGYAALHACLKDSLQEGLTDHDSRTCIACNPDSAEDTDATDDLLTDEKASRYTSWQNGLNMVQDRLNTKEMGSVLGKLSNVVKNKGAIVKTRLTNYIKNEPGPNESHVSSQDRGKRYRNMASVFSIGDEEDESLPGGSGSDDESTRETVNLDTWLTKPEVKYAFPCKEVKENGYMVPSHLLVTKTHLYILRSLTGKKGLALIQARRALSAVVKITSKKRHPELITFKYGTNDDDGLHITCVDRLFIPQACEATKIIKQQIEKVLEAIES